MPNRQFSSLLLIGLAVVLFLFSLALVLPVEQYCRFQRPAIVLLIIQLALSVVQLRREQMPEERFLRIASFVFVALGLAFNALLLLAARGRC